VHDRLEACRAVNLPAPAVGRAALPAIPCSLWRLMAGIGVGIVIAHEPLHGSGRAELPHPALASGDDAEAAHWIRMTASGTAGLLEQASPVERRRILREPGAVDRAPA
jgi:hypothetical protein